MQSNEFRNQEISPAQSGLQTENPSLSYSPGSNPSPYDQGASNPSPYEQGASNPSPYGQGSDYRDPRTQKQYTSSNAIRNRGDGEREEFVPLQFPSPMERYDVSHVITDPENHPLLRQDQKQPKFEGPLNPAYKSEYIPTEYNLASDLRGSGGSSYLEPGSSSKSLEDLSLQARTLDIGLDEDIEKAFKGRDIEPYHKNIREEEPLERSKDQVLDPTVENKERDIEIYEKPIANRRLDVDHPGLYYPGTSDDLLSPPTNSNYPPRTLEIYEKPEISPRNASDFIPKEELYIKDGYYTLPKSTNNEHPPQSANRYETVTRPSLADIRLRSSNGEVTRPTPRKGIEYTTPRDVMAPFSNKLNAAGDFWTLKSSDERSNDDVETFGEDGRIGDGENIEFEEGKKWKPSNIRHYRNMYKKNDTELEEDLIIETEPSYNNLPYPVPSKPAVRPQDAFNPAGSRPQDAYNPVGSRPQDAFNPAGSRPQDAFNPAGSRPQDAYNPTGSRNDRPYESAISQSDYKSVLRIPPATTTDRNVTTTYRSALTEFAPTNSPLNFGILLSEGSGSLGCQGIMRFQHLSNIKKMFEIELESAQSKWFHSGLKLNLNVLDECEGPRNMNKLDESYVLLKKSESSSQDLIEIKSGRGVLNVSRKNQIQELRVALGKIGIYKFHTLRTEDIYSASSIMDILRMDDTKTVLVDIVGQDLDFLVDRLQGLTGPASEYTWIFTSILNSDVLNKLENLLTRTKVLSIFPFSSRALLKTTVMFKNNYKLIEAMEAALPYLEMVRLLEASYFEAWRVICQGQKGRCAKLMNLSSRDYLEQFFNPFLIKRRTTPTSYMLVVYTSASTDEIVPVDIPEDDTASTPSIDEISGGYQLSTTTTERTFEKFLEQSIATEKVNFEMTENYLGAAAIDVTPGRNFEATERLDVDVTEYFTDNDFEINNLDYTDFSTTEFAEILEETTAYSDFSNNSDYDQEISTFADEIKIDTTEKMFEIEENSIDDNKNDDMNINIPDDYEYYDTNYVDQQVVTTEKPVMEKFNPMNEICNQFSGCILYIREDKFKSLEDEERLQSLVLSETMSQRRSGYNIGGYLISRETLETIDVPENLIATVTLDTYDPYIKPRIFHYNLMETEQYLEKSRDDQIPAVINKLAKKLAWKEAILVVFEMGDNVEKISTSLLNNIDGICFTGVVNLKLNFLGTKEFDRLVHIFRDGGTNLVMLTETTDQITRLINAVNVQLSSSIPPASPSNVNIMTWSALQTEDSLAEMAGNLPAKLNMMTVAEAGSECGYCESREETRLAKGIRKISGSLEHQLNKYSLDVCSVAQLPPEKCVDKFKLQIGQPLDAHNYNMLQLNPKRFISDQESIYIMSGEFISGQLVMYDMTLMGKKHEGLAALLNDEFGCLNSTIDYRYEQLTRSMESNLESLWGSIAIGVSAFGMLILIISGIYTFISMMNKKRVGFVREFETHLPLHYLLLLGLLLLFSSCLPFLLPLGSLACALRFVLPGVSLSIIFSSMLVSLFSSWRRTVYTVNSEAKSLCISCFTLDPTKETSGGLLMVALLLASVQIVITAVVISLSNPGPNMNSNNLECTFESSQEYGILVHAWLIVLCFATLTMSLACLKYCSTNRDARWSLLSLIGLISIWVTWVTLLQLLDSKNREAVTVMALVVSALVILLCVYARKLYEFSEFGKNTKLELMSNILLSESPSQSQATSRQSFHTNNNSVSRQSFHNSSSVLPEIIAMPESEENSILGDSIYHAVNFQGERSAPLDLNMFEAAERDPEPETENYIPDFETNSGLDTSTVRIHTRPPPERIGTWSRHTWQANSGGKVGLDGSTNTWEPITSKSAAKNAGSIRVSRNTWDPTPPKPQPPIDGDVNDGEWDGDEAEELGGGRAKESLEAERGSWEEESIYHTISSARGVPYKAVLKKIGSRKMLVLPDQHTLRHGSVSKI